MKHYIYTQTAFGEVVEQTICVHFKPEEMEALISLAYIGAMAPGEVEPENERLIDALRTALADAEDKFGLSNTEIPDFAIAAGSM